MLLINTSISWAQVNVTIDPTTQRVLGGVSKLDRSKFFNIHSGGDDAEHTALYNDYNVGQGRGFWGAFSYAKSQTGTVGVYPAARSGNSNVRTVKQYVATEHPGNTFVDGLDAELAGAWAAEYYKNFVSDGSLPEFFEPMNEPFVHAGDFHGGGWDPDEEARIRLQMARVYGAIGRHIHNAPELANMKVVGYSSAWPSAELWDFGHWDSRMKMFMDEAGEDMDAFSTHLYDGVNVSGQDNKRSGSNSEAILDLIETYSYTKWGVVKPHAITEYGAIEKGYGDNYSDLASIQTVRSINHILFNLMERQDKMAISIPFITGKATWHITAENNYQPYQAVLWKPTNIGEPTPAGWEYTPRIHFYELWKAVSGDRVAIDSDNPDIQVQAFVNGTKLFVALNNLDETQQTVSLNVGDLSNLVDVRIKSLKIYPDVDPVMSNTVVTAAPSSLTLIEGETIILEYTFSSDLSFSGSIHRKKYYDTNHLQDITSNTPITFQFANVETGEGKAKLRMTIGRKHDVSKSPTISVNGTPITVPSNWKGYDQANREDFFGTIEVPVDMTLIQASNTVTVTFPDNGGKLAALVLEVEKEEAEVLTQFAYPTGEPHIIPGLIEVEDYDEGGEGIAYHDASVTNQGNGGRMNEAVDLQNCSEGGLNLCWTAAEEWLEYTVDVQSSGEYVLSIRHAAQSANANVNVLFDGVNKTGTLSLPSTGNWQVYASTEKNINLEAGVQVMRLYLETGDVNINHIQLNKTVSTNIIEEEQASIKVYPNPTQGILKIEGAKAGDAIQVITIGGSVVKYLTLDESLSVDVGDLTNGMYYLLLQNTDQNITVPFIKK